MSYVAYQIIQRQGRSQGGPETPNPIPLKIMKDKTYPHYACIAY